MSHPATHSDMFSVEPPILTGIFFVQSLRFDHEKRSSNGALVSEIVQETSRTGLRIDLSFRDYVR